YCFQVFVFMPESNSRQIPDCPVLFSIFLIQPVLPPRVTQPWGAAGRPGKRLHARGFWCILLCAPDDSSEGEKQVRFRAIFR
ncbi:MAG: hypothetical protein PHP98_11495, partial [Kiritimatiellae bacterium]|nr:hypothetical protein [Kiritimatiellia bacterium]